MEPITIIHGAISVLDRDDVDTDQIVPKQFLKRVERTGFGEFLFYDWAKEPGWNLPRNPILVTGANFGCGSSREHAPWALQDYGFKAVVAPSFADIFYSNCTKSGLLPVVLPLDVVRDLMAADSAAIDLELQDVEFNGRSVAFDIDGDIKHRLLNGLDDIALSLEREEDIASYERERERRGALAIVSGEPEFGFDREGHVIDIQLGEQTESHRLIEHLMIAANEQVAKLLEERKLPALYRVHEQPDPQRVERLVEQLASLDVPTPPLPERLSPSQAGELVGEVSQAVDRHVRASRRGRVALTSLVLRSLKQAYYSPRNLGHAGLRSPRYCHFTSPIRRYPDLVCHRALLYAIGAADAPAPRSSGLIELGEWTSLRERDAMDIERSADDVARCFALTRERDGREWEGEIVGLIGAGAFVAFGGRYEGMIAVRRLRGDPPWRGAGWWELNEQGTILFGTRSGATLRLGDPIKVRVLRIEAAQGRVDLELA